MDFISEESDLEELEWIIPYDTPLRLASSDSLIDDEKVPQEGSADLHTSYCPFCSCLTNAEHDYLRMTGFRCSIAQRLIFHEECQSCSSPEGAQIPLCEFCKHLRLGHLVKCIWRDPGLDWLSINLDSEVRALSRTKCDLCDFLTKAISLPQTGPSEDEILVATSATLTIHKTNGDLRGARISGRRGNPTRGYSVDLLVHHCQAPINTLINSEEFVRWDLICRWLLENNKKHNRLYEIRPRPAFPPGFHVIDVKKRCVVEKKSHCEYMALSYVWGTRSESACYVEQATRDNIESLKVPGGLTQLPETIEDAIAMCQKLGINHLWVDRYCIVQDHAVHKHTQVGAMADIYSSATVTVIACSGKDGVESGIPGVRRKRRWKRRGINIQGLSFSYRYPVLDEILSRSIWNTRGWTYQEAILSKRKLIMTPTEVWFQCNRKIFREHCPDDRFHHRAALRYFTGSYGGYSSFMNYIVNLQVYTMRKLGYASDIYNAFDGIAHAIYGRDYAFHFGLPESQFDHALLWYCGYRWIDSGSRCLRVCPETTPSWSWASVTCGVVHVESFCMTLVKWVLYKTQVANMSSPCASPETYRTYSKDLKAIDNPETWDCPSYPCEYPYSQLILALAVNEGCIETCNPITIPEEESFSSLGAHFRRRWPSYKDAYEEVRQVDARQSSGPNGVLFTTAQSAVFHIKSKWIKNANGMVVGSLYQMETYDLDSDDDQSLGHEMYDFYEECSIHKECSADEECIVDGIALSIPAEPDEILDVMSEDSLDPPSPGTLRIPRSEKYCDMTYFDSKGDRLRSMPGVNVMFIRRKDGYARRIGLGWIALKQWSSLDWTLKDIWLK